MVFVDGVEDWSTGIACAQPGLRGRFRTEGAEGLTASCGVYNVFLYICIYIYVYMYIYICVEYIILYNYIQLYTYVCDHMWVCARKINT